MSLVKAPGPLHVPPSHWFQRLVERGVVVPLVCPTIRMRPWHLSLPPNLSGVTGLSAPG